MQKNKMYGNKIRAFRTLRGFSQEYMAEKLSVNQNTYSRIENNKHKLSVEQVETIAKELGVTIADITSNEPIIIQNQASNHGTQIGHNENLYVENKGLLQKIIDAKDSMIADKEREIERLTKQVERLLVMLEKK